MPESVTDRCTKAHEYVFLLSKSARYFFDADAIKEPCSESTHARISQNLAAQVGSHRANGGGKTNGPMKAVIAGSTRKLAEAGSGIASNRSYESALALKVESRNKRSVWTVGTLPYSGAHFATFPPALILPCILAGCPAQCCAKCGAPWERVVEIESHTDRPQSRPMGTRGNQPSLCASVGQPQQGSRYTTSTTLGHRPTCGCNADTRPGTVMDPFGGSGTTGEVASGNGRRAVLIELNPEYAKLATDRCGLFCSPNRVR
jgi:hypothetical protein